MSFTPYLSFQGQAADAFAFYKGIFGGILTTHGFAEMPPGGGMPDLTDDQKSWLMHAQLILPDGAILMGADMPPQFGGQPQSGVSVSVWRAGADDARALFDRLAEGGEMTMPFAETFFSKGFGMCRDRFGTSWMVATGDPAAS